QTPSSSAPGWSWVFTLPHHPSPFTLHPSPFILPLSNVSLPAAGPSSRLHLLQISPRADPSLRRSIISSSLPHSSFPSSVATSPSPFALPTQWCFTELSEEEKEEEKERQTRQQRLDNTHKKNLYPICISFSFISPPHTPPAHYSLPLAPRENPRYSRRTHSRSLLPAFGSGSGSSTYRTSTSSSRV
ncbi:hypothetical protein CORC01_13187, partial [Colletotrichum orchidophilum]